MKIKSIILMGLLALSAPAVCQTNPRDFLTTEFANRITPITFTNSSGDVQTLWYENKFGRFKRDFKAFFLSESAVAPGASINDIPTVGLAMEHWWMSFELLMKAQREYASCVAGINENLLRLGQTCLLDQPCNPLYDTVLTIREYWIPFNIASYPTYPIPPTKEVFLDHFRAGMASVNQAVYHVGLCESTLVELRKMKSKGKK